jgi:hypothetical protein
MKMGARANRFFHESPGQTLPVQPARIKFVREIRGVVAFSKQQPPMRWWRTLRRMKMRARANRFFHECPGQPLSVQPARIKFVKLVKFVALLHFRDSI